MYIHYWIKVGKWCLYGNWWNEPETCVDKERSQSNECVLRRPCDDPTNSNNWKPLWWAFWLSRIVFADWDLLKLLTVFSRIFLTCRIVLCDIWKSQSHCYPIAKAFCCVVSPIPSSRQNLLCNFSFWYKAGKRPPRLQSP